jgi:hypothetical protein
MKHSLENKAGATIGAGFVNPSEAHEFFPRFSEVCVEKKDWNPQIMKSFASN